MCESGCEKLIDYILFMQPKKGKRKKNICEEQKKKAVNQGTQFMLLTNQDVKMREAKMKRDNIIQNSQSENA